MMNARAPAWLVCGVALLACTVQTRETGGGFFAQAGASSTIAVSVAGSSGLATCPNNEPVEGETCGQPGASCSGYGSPACPATAWCDPDHEWQIHCPATHMGSAPCRCAHADILPEPAVHRSAAIPCSRGRAFSASAPDAGCEPSDGGGCSGACSQDSDCTLGTNGRCGIWGPAPVYSCSYDACVSDAECGSGALCVCRELDNLVAPNRCASKSQCQIDTDCGFFGFCSPSQAHEWCQPFYACHT